MKRLIFLKNKETNFEKMINTTILDLQSKVVDVTLFEWDKIERCYYLGLLMEEQMKQFNQNCLLLDERRPQDLTKDLDDFSSVMLKAKNVEYKINFVKNFALFTSRGLRYFAFVLYED